MVALKDLTIGVIGVGTIASSCIKGLLCPDASIHPKRIILSPRNAEKSAQLLHEFGAEKVEIAQNNQAVLDAAEVILIAVLVPQADSVLSELRFESRHHIISLMAAVSLSLLVELTAPATKCCIAIPLPIVAKRRGVTLMMPPDDIGKILFDALGTTVTVDQDAHFKKLLVMTFLMGDLYQRQKTALDWLIESGVDADTAASYVGGLFRSMLDDTANAKPDTFEKLVQEQTPGGMNEMIIREQANDGAYNSLLDSLQSAHTRLLTGSWDPNLTPAARRQARTTRSSSSSGT
mmetsp:Transcript_12784/g.19181  ORF Transcript_12784/g.19181 Transcript_12784/m.19181 type:complete len:291 (-) Transcript_12784:74-946(-)